MASIIKSTTTDGIQIIPDSTGAFAIQTNGANTALTIDTSQNVGIGTASPSYKLEVRSSSDTEIGIVKTSVGTVKLGSYTGTESRLTSDPGYITFYTGSPTSERMRIDSSGNVGIGTTSPGGRLHLDTTNDTIFRMNTSGTNIGYLEAYTGGATPLFAIYSVPVNGNMTFGTNNTERMRIDSSGNVGIGTSTTSGKLNIVGGSLSTSTTGLSFASGLAAGRLITDATNSVISAINGVFDSQSLELSQGSSSGWVSGITISGRNSSSSIPDAIALFTRSTERMRIHASGGVSIGNTTDSGAASLNVSGSMSGGYIAHAAGTTAMAFGADNVVRVTPNATATYTSTVPAAGAICVLSILTSGTTSYTITFGTGFKSTGTLATGTVSARYFNITFVSDGTNLIETSRTVAIA